MLTLGERIKYVRKSNGLNQVEFSKMIGVSQGTLSEIEKNKYKPSIEIIILIHKNFMVDLDWLLIHSNEAIYSEDSYLSKVGTKEVKLLKVFRKLSNDDQDEIIEIIELKINRY